MCKWNRASCPLSLSNPPSWPHCLHYLQQIARSNHHYPLKAVWFHSWQWTWSKDSPRVKFNNSFCKEYCRSCLLKLVPILEWRHRMGKAFSVPLGRASPGRQSLRYYSRVASICQARRRRNTSSDCTDFIIIWAILKFPRHMLLTIVNCQKLDELTSQANQRLHVYGVKCVQLTK